MRRKLTYATGCGTVVCHLPSGENVTLPVIPGILKHPRSSELAKLLTTPETAEKYTRLALEKCAWPILRQFPRHWLLAHIASVSVREGRKKALYFLLSCRDAE